MTETPLTAIQDAHGVDTVEAEDAVAWLSHFGYLAGSILSGAFAPFLALTSLAVAIMEMQRVAGLPQTGMLDDATRAKMAEPRCGNLDVQRMVEFARWRKNRLTYKIETYLSGMSTSDQDDLQEEGWKAWHEHADVLVRRVMSGPADITVTAAQGRANGFDGPGGTLAYCFLPDGRDSPIKLVFDMAEAYVRSLSQGQRGILYGNVDKHEKGHAFGLDHSGVSSALMAPYYSPGISKPQGNDDVARIQALYGPATSAPAPTPTPVPGPNQDRVAVTIGGKIYRGSLTQSAS
jgi:hypothetical protein